MQVRFGGEVEAGPHSAAERVDRKVLHVAQIQLVPHVHLVIRPRDKPGLFTGSEEG